MELRYAAHISGDPRLLADIQANRDIFQQLAEQTWPGQGHRMRDVVKIAVYATLYGAGLSLVTGMLGLTRHEAELFRNGLAARYPVLWTTMRQVQETVAVTGGVILPVPAGYPRGPTSRTWPSTSWCKGAAATHSVSAFWHSTRRA